MKFFSLPISGIFLLMAMFSEVAVAQHNFQCDYLSDIDQDNDGLIEICDIEGLDEMRHQLDGTGYMTSFSRTKITEGCPSTGCTGYELARSLDFMDGNSYRIPTNKTRYIVTTGTDVGWQPIGDFSSMPFSATFDGNGHTISNLMINRTSTRFVGLFGYTRTTAKIKNLSLLDVDISGLSRVGSLVGRNDGTITNSYAIGTVSGRFETGGLVGLNQGGSITNSHAMGAVSGHFDIGGLVGQNDNGSITHSYATAEVKGSTNRVGGLAGRNTNGTIMSGYATGSVEGKEDVGGLAGSNNNGSIMNSYATGDVSGLSNVSNLVGSNSGPIINSYATGNVTAIGRIPFGLVASTSDEISHSYWLSGSAALGGIISNTGVRIDGKTAEELKSPVRPGTAPTDVYYNWDADVWDFGTANQFPILKTSDGNLLPGQGVGLRELKVVKPYAELSPAFGDATTPYLITSYSTNGSMQNIALKLTAYNPNTTIKLVKKGEDTDYFANKGSSGRSDSIAVDDSTVLDITVREANLDTTSYGVEIILEQVTLPPCTASLNLVDDNDGIERDMDIDRDGDGLIEICDIEGLDEMRYQLDGAGYITSMGAAKVTDGCPSTGCTGYELTRNLDFMDDNSYRLATNKARYLVTTATDVGWQPIGNPSMTFNATFDGNGHTISNLMINRTNTRFVGLFSHTGTAAKIENLGLLDVAISGRSRVGSLVGNNNGTITNSYAVGTVSGRFDTGGLVGMNQGGTITNSHVIGTVSGRTDLGGLVGQNDDGNITHSYAIAEVKGSSNRVGGLAGRNPNGAIMSSYAAGKVDGEDDVGGLVGSNDDGGSIENSYATSDISGLSNASNLVGSNTGTITNSYAIGNVTVAGRVQTLGLVAATSNDVNHSYWLSGSAALGGIINAFGRIDAGKTAEELKSPIRPGTAPTDVYYNWNDTIWDFGTSNQLPILKTLDGNLIPDQGVGLRELKVVTSYAELSPTFGDATTPYVITSYSTNGGMQNIVLKLTAYNPDATIELVKEEENTNYFADKGSSGRSDFVTVDGNTVLDITVREANRDITFYRIKTVSEQVILAPCTAFLNFLDDNDDVEQDMDIDKDDDGLIEICDVEGLDEMSYSYQLDSTGHTTSTGTMKITDGCPSGGCTGYELMRSLNFIDNNSYRIPTNKAKYIVTNTTDVGWQPIGDFNKPFTSIFDGNGHTISNLMINRTNTRYVGLFGYTGTAAKIANLGLLDVDISGQSLVGSLVGNNNGTITNSYAMGTVSGRFDTGGLVGVNQEGTITHSYAMGTVSGRTDLGGLVGQNDNGSITHSYAIAEVKGSSNRVGGLAGRNPNGSIMSSYAAGKVDGQEDVGGLVGNNSGTIMNSYATSDISGLSNASNLVGSNTGSITSSYAIGDVIAIGRAQTLGLVAATSREINHSYWLSGSAALGGIINAFGRIDAEKTAEELKSPTKPGASTSTDVYYNWDDTIWDFGTSDQFPVLKDSDGNLIPGQGVNIENSNLREGLRQLKILKVLRAKTNFDQPFGVSTNNYTVMVSTPKGITTRSIVLMLEAYNPDAEIQIFKTADSTNYFAGRRSGDESLPIVVSEATELAIMVSEPDIDYTLVFSVEELQSIRLRIKVFLEGPLL